jgi:short-subunit dehydrogenase
MTSVFVSGGTGAIGNEIVRRLVADGYEVEFSFCHSRDEADDLLSQLGTRHHQIDYAGDWTPPAKPVDVLVNNAGVNLSGHGVSETSDDELRSTLEINLMAPLRLARHYIPTMIDQGFGRIININSLWGLSAPAHRMSYAISKFVSMAIEFRALAAMRTAR